MAQKVVINSCFGVFGLSHKAILRYAEIKGITLYPEKKELSTTYWTVPEGDRIKALPEPWFSNTIEAQLEYNKRYREEVLYDQDIARDDPALIQVVEEMSQTVNGRFAELKVIEIPDGIDWQIEEYDGNEHVAQKHLTWS